MRQDKVISQVLGGDAVLAPSDLYNKEFPRVILGGYQTQAVDAYLERVADVLEGLIKQVRDLKQQQEEHRATLEEFRQMEETLRSALVTSQKFGENLIESARREADSLVESARVEKQRVQNCASKLPSALASEIGSLQQQRDRLRKEMLAVLATHRSLLESMESAEETVGLGRGDSTICFGFDREDESAAEVENPSESPLSASKETSS
jgi:cell division initiation protein